MTFGRWVHGDEDQRKVIAAGHDGFQAPCGEYQLRKGVTGISRQCQCTKRPEDFVNKIDAVWRRPGSNRGSTGKTELVMGGFLWRNRVWISEIKRIGLPLIGNMGCRQEVAW